MKADRLTKETIKNIDAIDRNFPDFSIGDMIRVSQFVKEGDKERLQVFEGNVIAMHKNGISSTFTVRRIGANNIGIERIYPYYAPVISSIQLVKKGDVRRAKLYYVRDRIGKSARIKEKVIVKATTGRAKSQAE